MPSSVLAKNLAIPKGAQGKSVVAWVDARGKSLTAEVTGGTYPNLNLRVRGLPKASQNKTAVAKRTAMTQTNVWYYYL